MSNKAISILIPIYNSVCVKQVKELSAQAQQLNVDYEIIVADDDSPLKDVVRDNEAINDMPNCQYIVKPTNTGSAATRNFLAERSHYPAKRQKQRYQEFRSTNFMIRRDVFLQNPFDERFTKSGYEDVLFGKHLKHSNAAILHIDNPVTMTASSRAMPTLWLRPRRACAPYTSSAATCAAIPACSHWYRAYTSQPSCGSCAFGTECLEQ